MLQSAKLENLSKKLQKHYARKGNRIVFSNGMTLNQLAFAMWERLGYREIDASVLSRVLKGERLFSSKQIETYCKILKLKKQEQKDLIYALGLDISRRFGIPVSFLYSNVDVLINIIEANDKLIETAKRTSSFKNTDEWLKQLIFQIDRSLHLVNEIQRNKLLNLKAELVMHRAWILPSITTDWNNNKNVETIKNELLMLSRYLKRKDLAEIIKLIEHQSSYLRKDFGSTVEIVESTDFSFINNIEYEVDMLRGALVCYVKLKKEQSYIALKSLLLKKFVFCSNDLKAKICQGISYSESKLGNYMQSRRYMDKAWIYFDASKNDSDFQINRKLQLVKTEMEIAKELKNSNLYYLENIGKEALLLSNYVGHSYYGLDIERNMNELFNTT